ncbi:hypothetical protein T265_02031 [Opisthorchis viverrini]|uniref:Uncharacterized protein n=1 Tax=Opisthorchis viverrini TaxID=6198 RepID=A0A075AIK6_OPIVI|nr:hypothetical protein T265_02031 [Opisthorchis viverrini]KER31799.1 hypothetical protein T265_02031 [Opisthorchis viverrini]
MRDSASVRRIAPNIAQWVAEVNKPSHHSKVWSILDGHVLTDSPTFYYDERHSIGDCRPTVRKARIVTNASLPGKHWTGGSLLLELIRSAYPVTIPGFELHTSDV